VGDNMMRFSFVLMALIPNSKALDISYVDSKTNNNITYVLVDDCAVPIFKKKVGNQCYVLKKVNDFCHLQLNMDDCK
jgi:hypothetical protein